MKPEGTAVLERILGPKRAEIARMLAGPRVPPRRTPGGGVIEALRRSAGAPLRLIAEVKLRSPSAGELSSVLTPADRALRYAAAGATMISVLTDKPFFGGSYDALAACRDALDAALGAARPRLLCKEFILHPIQLARAQDAGADAALLIARIVSPEDLALLAAEARTLGIEPFIEVATEAELDAAEAAGARLIGVNARDLDTLVMDPERAARVLARIREGVVRVHLSGLGSPEAVARVAEGPADAALIGEALMRQDDPTELLSAMVRAAGGG
ncbi:indole-3-glycerol phosphate synthase TrpC [Polyangium aurulentum]|uniref:indole-3-glycerol phosphate synthase TrpC n=1 Tax=Polyangium aurulentum TaxID=2567896 RepID=UPI0010ADE003|nr:indole-3-glycerol-phosphate synthase [Polyangium aurulentum]UQA54866.1 indole-3-glycerol-phosphate synthase [Polyangium aurulentum]